MSSHRTLSLALIVTALVALAFILPLAPVDVRADEEPGTEGGPGSDLVDRQMLVDANTEFALDLYDHIADVDDSAGKNLFLSPYSISQALTMTLHGARTETAEQMENTLHYNSRLAGRRLAEAWASLNTELTTPPERPSYAEDDWTPLTFNNANSIWAQEGYPIQPDYLSLLDEVYRAPARRVDFTADPEACRQIINRWVEDKTEDKIQDLIPEDAIDELTTLVLVNAIYFLGQWKSAFDPEHTKDGQFQTAAGESVTVPMMYQQDSFGYARGDGYEIVELPYNLSSCAMTIVVPDAGNYDAFENGLTTEWLNDALDGISYDSTRLTMPQFDLLYDIELSDVLKAMGMELPFDPRADFSGMAPNLYIGLVIHKAFCAVDEAGTEAAAATAVLMERGGMPRNPNEITIDRPFLFFIRDRETGTILFMGRVLDPTQ